MVSPYDTDVICRAEELYTVDCLTYERVRDQLHAEGVDVSIQTLKRWGSEYGWTAERKRIREAQLKIKTDFITYRASLLSNAMKTLNAKDAFAVSSIENVAQKAVEFAAKQADQNQTHGRQAAMAPVEVDNVAATPVKIESPKDALELVQRAIEKKVNLLVLQPDTLTAKSIKDLRESMDLLNKLKAQYTVDEDSEDKPEGLSDKAVDDIMSKFLGIGKG